MFPVVVTLCKPHVEVFVIALQVFAAFQRGFIQKTVHRAVEAFDLAGGFRAVWLGIQQLDPKNGAGAIHPFGAVLAAIVKVDSPGQALFQYSFAKTILLVPTDFVHKLPTVPVHE